MGTIMYDAPTDRVFAYVKAVQPPPAGQFGGWPCPGFQQDLPRGHLGAVNRLNGAFAIMLSVGVSI